MQDVEHEEAGDGIGDDDNGGNVFYYQRYSGQNLQNWTVTGLYGIAVPRSSASQVTPSWKPSFKEVLMRGLGSITRNTLLETVRCEPAHRSEGCCLCQTRTEGASQVLYSHLRCRILLGKFS